MAGTLSTILRASVAAAVAVLALCAASPAAHAQVPQPMVGYNDNFNDFDLHTTNPFDQIIDPLPLPDLPLPLPGDETDPEANGKQLMDLARTGGADVIRYVVPWSRVERKRGKYDWTIEDQTYELAREAGLRPLIVLHTAPCWSHESIPCPKGENPTARPDPEHLGAYGEFVKAAIKRYPEAVAFEIWNESNLKRFWGEDPTPRSYAALLAAVDRHTSGLSGHPPILYNGLTPNKKADKYLKRSLIRFGAADTVDSTAIHPYVGAGGIGEVRKKIRSARKVLRKARAPRSLWITEIGWSTHPESEIGVTTGAQRGLIDGVIGMAPEMRIKAVVVHRLLDVEVSSPWESGLGVINLDGSPKPLYCLLGLGFGLKQLPSGC